MPYKINNKRDHIYSTLQNLLDEYAAQIDGAMRIIVRGKIDALLSNLKDLRIGSSGAIDYKNTIGMINQLFLGAKFLGFYNIIKFIFSDLISFSQNLRMIKEIMQINLEESVDDVISYFVQPLQLVVVSYISARSGKWNNILTEIIRGIKSINIEGKTKEDLLPSIITISEIIFDNDFSDQYYQMSKKEMEEVIIFVYSLQDENSINKRPFKGAMMILIQKYAASYFSFEEGNLYHITSKERLIKMIKNNESWIKKTENLNDPKDQESFKKIVGYDAIINNNPNNSYASFSLTTSTVPKDTIFRYAKSLKNALILEYDRFSVQNILNPLRMHKINEMPVIVSMGSLIGKVIYDKEEMSRIWDSIETFLVRLKHNFGIEVYESTREKAANVCKCFYKDSKWSNEKEVRVVNNGFEDSINSVESGDYWKLSPSVLTIFNRMYFNDDNYKSIQKAIYGQKLIKESFEVAQTFIHFNSNDKIPEFKSKFKTIDRFLEKSK